MWGVAPAGTPASLPVGASRRGHRPDAAMLETAREVTQDLPVELRQAGFEDPGGMVAGRLRASSASGTRCRASRLRRGCRRCVASWTATVGHLRHPNAQLRPVRRHARAPQPGPRHRGVRTTAPAHVRFRPDTWQFNILRLPAWRVAVRERGEAPTFPSSVPTCSGGSGYRLYWRASAASTAPLRPRHRLAPTATKPAG